MKHRHAAIFVPLVLAAPLLLATISVFLPVHDAAGHGQSGLTLSPTDLVQGPEREVSGLAEAPRGVLPNFTADTVIGSDDRVQVTNTTAIPWRWIVHLEMDFDGDFIADLQCTGYLVGPATVLTAGHCVYDDLEDNWADVIYVTPAQNGASNPYGVQFVYTSSLYTTTGWINDLGPEYDSGYIVLPNTTFFDQVGAFPYAVTTDSQLVGSTINGAGYAADRHSETMSYDFGPVTQATTRLFSYEMDTGSGQSGGPVWHVDGSNRYAIGIHTYGYGIITPCNPSDNCAVRITSAVADNIVSLGGNSPVSLPTDSRQLSQMKESDP